MCVNESLPHSLGSIMSSGTVSPLLPCLKYRGTTLSPVNMRCGHRSLWSRGSLRSLLPPSLLKGVVSECWLKAGTLGISVKRER